jgi:hypothetical protein
VRPDGVTAASMKMAVFWIVAIVNALKTEAKIASETSVNFYQSIQRKTPDDSHLHSILICWIILCVCQQNFYVCHQSTNNLEYTTRIIPLEGSTEKQVTYLKWHLMAQCIREISRCTF